MFAFPILTATAMAGAAVLAASAAPHTGTDAGRPTVSRTAHSPAVAVGTYVIRSVNGHGLPFADRIPGTPGYEHRATLSRAAVRLDPNGAFRLTAHYAHEHALRSSAWRPAPEKDDVVKGRWTLQGTALTLVPAKSARGRQPRPIVGRLTGSQLVLPYDVRAGAGARRYVFVGSYDPTYF